MATDAETGIWAAIDALTKPSLRRIDHDQRGTIWGEVPSLWDQANQALYGEVGPGGPSGPKDERSVADLDLMERLYIIRDTTREELQRRHIDPGHSTPIQLVQLGQHVVRRELDELWWWVYRFASWANWLEISLQLVEKPPTPYIRSTPCPQCGTRQVILDRATGKVIRCGKPGCINPDHIVVSALHIIWVGNYTRDIECQQCGFVWFRGAGFNTLSDLVGRRTA